VKRSPICAAANRSRISWCERSSFCRLMKLGTKTAIKIKKIPKAMAPSLRSNFPGLSMRRQY
jgi:hypothetical protein